MDLDPTSPFGPANLPYGVFRRRGEGARVGARLGDHVIDLAALARAGLLDAVPGAQAAFAAASLNPLMSRGREAWTACRKRLQELVGDDAHHAAVSPAVVPLPEAELLLPVHVADFADFYSSLEHARNIGRLFRPQEEPLLPNWRHLPVGYHGRAGTVVVGGTPVRRPHGQWRLADAEVPSFGPSLSLDLELELGFVVGAPSRLGVPVGVDEALEHVFGVVLLNDWSARDLQAWEYQPLGPFLGKSFATSIGAWVVSLDALAAHRVPAPDQEPEPLPYLREEPWALDVDLEVGLRSAAMQARGEPPDRVSRTSARNVYWSAAQQIAHLTVNGAGLRTGDLVGTGTISGAGSDERGSLIELTWNGAEPLELSDGSRRTFLEDGDEVVLRGLAGAGSDRPIGFGEVWGRIDPAGPS